MQGVTQSSYQGNVDPKLAHNMVKAFDRGFRMGCSIEVSQESKFTSINILLALNSKQSSGQEVAMHKSIS